jgi:hypothetical protein
MKKTTTVKNKENQFVKMDVFMEEMKKFEDFKLWVTSNTATKSDVNIDIKNMAAKLKFDNTMETIDKMMSEIDASRQERNEEQLTTKRYFRINDMLIDHESRIGVLEKPEKINDRHVKL